MRAYTLTTGVIFALLVVAHIWRMIVESSSLATDPGYVLITVAAGLLSLWAMRLLIRSRSP
jgi:predicted Co/Zn/Cd cation transporter (cation efflux family)